MVTMDKARCVPIYNIPECPISLSFNQLSNVQIQNYTVHQLAECTTLTTSRICVLFQQNVNWTANLVVSARVFFMMFLELFQHTIESLPCWQSCYRESSGFYYNSRPLLMVQGNMVMCCVLSAFHIMPVHLFCGAVRGSRLYQEITQSPL